MTEKPETVADVLTLPANWREQAARHRECGPNGKMLAQIRETCAEDLERALSAQQPVAWRIVWSPYPDCTEVTADHAHVLELQALETPPTIEPLYATPQPSAEPAYDRGLIADMLHQAPIIGPGEYTREAVAEQVRLLRAADNADGAGVRTVSRARAADGVGALVANWRSRAEENHAAGCVICAAMLEGCAIELEQCLASAQQPSAQNAEPSKITREDIGAAHLARITEYERGAIGAQPEGSP